MKKTKPEFNKKQAVALKAILDAPNENSKSLSYCEATGFLFVVACSPELINPNQWLPVVLDLRNSADSGLDDINVTMELVIGLYNEVNRQVQDADVSLLPGCEFLDNPQENFEDDAPIHQWATGFVIGNDWLKKLITQYTPDDLKDELGGQMMALSFFANRDIATSFIQEIRNENVTVASMAADMQGLFPDAMTGFAHLAHSIQQALQEKQSDSQQPAHSDKVGRNDPCHCGSGKKYKKCCGAVLH